MLHKSVKKGIGVVDHTHEMLPAGFNSPNSDHLAVVMKTKPTANRMIESSEPIKVQQSNLFDLDDSIGAWEAQVNKDFDALEDD